MALLAFCALWLTASLPPCHAAETRRPTIGLALGGGSARGMAHLGVLRYLEEQRIPVDRIAGTSIGSVVGALYATGLSAAEIADIMREADWDNFFLGDIPYPSKDFRRKQDRRDYPVRLEFGLRGGFRLPSGLEPGHSLGLLLDRLTLPYGALPSFDDLPIPFRAVATDLDKAEPVVLSDGSLSLALRASVAIPGVFTPVRVGGRLLADGGLLNNVPADVAKSMGAEVIIAVDVGAKLQERTYLESFTALMDRALTVMVVARTREVLSLADLIISPDLGTVGATDWKKSDAIATLGYDSIKLKGRFLSALSLDQAAWEEHLAARRSRMRRLRREIEFVSVEGIGPREQEAIQRALARHLGRPLQEEALERDLTAIAGWGRFESVGYEETISEGRTGLRIRATEKSHGPPFANFLFRVNNARQGAMDVVLGSRLTFMDIGKHGSELRVDLQMGSEQLIGAEYFHRLYGSRWFVAPRGAFASGTQNLYLDGSRVADYQIRQGAGNASLGYQFTRNSQASLGYHIGYVMAKVRTGDPLLPALEGRTTGPSVQWQYNRLDSPMIPASGVFVDSRFRWVLDSPGATADFTSGEIHFGGFQPLSDKNTMFLLFDAGTTFDRAAPAIYQFTLGGPFRLGAYDLDEFRGDRFVYLSPGYLRKIARLPDFIGGNAFLGGWVEVGKAFSRADLADFKIDVSGGLLMESPLGPLLIGGSWGEGGRWNFNFNLGSLLRRDQWIR